ncbi:MAG: hypothetical protein LBP64_10720 [Tannerella sp.]|nr:hypothetical protein [Tannerella sp.]
MIDVSLSVSCVAPLTLTCSLTLPDGLSLDPNATALADGIKDTQILTVDEEPDGKWKFEIKPKTDLPAASVTDAAGKIANIAYTVSESVGTPSGNDVIAAQTSVFAARDILTVRTPVEEDITLYDIKGAQLLRARKPAGTATFALNGLPRGVLIVRGSSGWTKKAVN